MFRDNFSARTFRVPVGWISRIGLLMGLLAGVSLISTLLAAKYYRLARRGSPARVNELEDELNSLRSSFSTLQAKLLTKVEPAPAPVATATVAAAPPPPPPPPAPVSQESSSGGTPHFGTPLLFADLPPEIGPVPQPSGGAQTASLPVTMGTPKLRWHGPSLEVQAPLEYAGPSGGNQQGRIVVIARGPETLLAYPTNVLNPVNAPALIAPERGEFFSVSRYREIHVTFPPIHPASSLKEVEILIFGIAGDPDSSAPPNTLLIREHVAVPPATSSSDSPAAAHPKPPRTHAPETPAAEDSAAPHSAAPGAPAEGAPAQTPWPAPAPGAQAPAAQPPAAGAPPTEAAPPATSAPAAPAGDSQKAPAQPPAGGQ